MAKQTGYVKATGTVDGDTNFYYDQMWGYLVRMRPGVSSKRFWKDAAFEGSRRSAERFGTGSFSLKMLHRQFLVFCFLFLVR
jgi:hypothetical protein